MSSALASVWSTVWGLLVDDGQLAIGIVISLIVTWILASSSNEFFAQNSGWFLLAMLVALLSANLLRAARVAGRKLVADR